MLSDNTDKGTLRNSLLSVITAKSTLRNNMRKAMTLVLQTCFYQLIDKASKREKRAKARHGAQDIYVKSPLSPVGRLV